MVFDTIEAEGSDLRIHVQLCSQRHKDVAVRLEDIVERLKHGEEERHQMLDALTAIKADMDSQKKLALGALALLLSMATTIFTAYGAEIAAAVLRMFAAK